MESPAKAIKQVEQYKNMGLNFQYKFDYDVLNKQSFVLSLGNYSLFNILSCLRKDEVITFLINHGMKDFNKKSNKLNYDEKYRNSIYWENKYYGDMIRIVTNYPDFIENIRDGVYLIERRNKIIKIKSKINENI